MKSRLNKGEACNAIARAVFMPRLGESEIEDWKPELLGQQADIADCGDLTVEFGVYRKSRRFSEAKI